MINNRIYSDFDVMFGANPNTGDIGVRVNENAVKFAVKNLVLTNHYERPFDSSIGTSLRGFLFDNINDMSIVAMQEVIRQTLTNHEPRIDVINIDISPVYDDNSIQVTIVFSIKNTEKPLSVSVALHTTR
jgi:phage baseplate assembly protein W